MNPILSVKIDSIKFIEWLNHRNPKHDEYYHYGIDCNYGIELEFMSNGSRSVIASRVNSCMMEQNDGQFFRSKSILNPELNDSKNITAAAITDADNDQWSMFMIEPLQNYHSNTMRGLAKCDNIGISGLRLKKILLSIYIQI